MCARFLPQVQANLIDGENGMNKRVLLCFALVLLSCVTAMAQQAPMQPLTFWYEYTVNPGKDEQFLDLVKTVGAPVRDKLMADGVVLAWGVQTPLLRAPGNATHMIWYAVADWSGIEKVQTAMQAQIAKLTEEAAKSGATKKGATPGQGPSTRIMDVADVSKTHDYLTRDLVFNVTHAAPPEGLLPYTRFNFVKVKPGKGGDYRKAEELLDEAELLDPELDVVEMYRLLLNINKTRKLPAVGKTRKLPGTHKTKQPHGLKNVKKEPAKND